MPEDGVPALKGPTTTLSRLGWILLAGIGVAAVASLFVGFGGLAAAFAIAVLIFEAAFAVGGLLGFLFGVPRVMTREGGEATAKEAPPAAAADAATPPGEAGARRQVLQSNTNLERISDWLATMLVGVGLVQLHKVNDLLVEFRDFLSAHARVFGEGEGEAAHAGQLPLIGCVVLILGAAGGFMFMYLNTRLMLSKVFNEVENLLQNANLSVSTSQAVLSKIEGISGSFVQSVDSQKRQLSVDDALGLMFDALYQPGGYRTVIEMAGMLSRTPAVQRADYWFYLACAFGQQHAEADGARNLDLLMSARDNALDAVRRALAIDATYRLRFKALTDPDGPDGDLASLRDDRVLRSLLKRPA
jgi:hypothetical protein